MRLKAQITGSILKRSPKTGIFVFRNFELISWIFTILLVVSAAYTSYAGYNYYYYGNCNGPNNDGFCIFDPSGANSRVSSVQAGTCSVVPEKQAALALNGFNSSLFPTLNAGAKNKVVFIGCFTCQYTREVYPEMRKLASRSDVEFTFAHLHLGNGNDFLTPLTNCIYEDYPDKFLSTLDLLFNSPVINLSSINSTLSIISSLNINQTSLVQCINSSSSAALASQQLEEIKKTNIYGTPLVFVNDEPIEGPKPARVYERLLN
jgi:protein-disulfide isomerase